MITRITEFRQLTFADEDVKKALFLFSEKQNKKLLKGPIRELQISKNENDELEVSVKVDIQIGGKCENVELSGAFLGAAMLNYCFISGIPIPKKANKKIDIIDEKIVIQIRINRDGV